MDLMVASSYVACLAEDDRFEEESNEVWILVIEGVGVVGAKKETI